jgi:hypothetical protein
MRFLEILLNAKALCGSRESRLKTTCQISLVRYKDFVRFFACVSLKVAFFATTAWGQVYTYDADGILRHADFGGTNRLTYGFDLAGNLTSTRGPTQLEVWRHQNFGTLNSDGAAADHASPAKDGIPNLVKYALGLAPSQPVVGTNLGKLAKTQNGVEFEYWARSGDQRLSVRVQRSADLSTWTTDNIATNIIGTNGSLNLFKALHIGSASRQFLRLNFDYRQ